MADIVDALNDAHRESPSWRLAPLCHQAATEIARLRALIAERDKALEPFVRAADNFDTFAIKNPEEWFAYGGQVSATENKGAISVGDLRRARKAWGGEDV